MLLQPCVWPLGLSVYAVAVWSACACRYESTYAAAIVLVLDAPGLSLKSPAMMRGSPNPAAHVTSSCACVARTPPPHGEHSRVTTRCTARPLTSMSTTPAVFGPSSIDAGTEYECTTGVDTNRYRLQTPLWLCDPTSKFAGYHVTPVSLLSLVAKLEIDDA